MLEQTLVTISEAGNLQFPAPKDESKFCHAAIPGSGRTHTPSQAGGGRDNSSILPLQSSFQSNKQGLKMEKNKYEGGPWHTPPRGEMNLGGI